MKPQKVSGKQIEKIDLGTKIIFQYPLKTKLMSVAYMVVNGRSPKGKNNFFLEHDCSFIIFLTKGSGEVYAGEEVFEVETHDMVLVPSGCKFAMEGEMEYVTVDVPAFYPEQSKEIRS